MLTAESSIAIETLSGETLTEILGSGEVALRDCLTALFLSSDWLEEEEPVDKFPTDALTPRA